MKFRWWCGIIMVDSDPCDEWDVGYVWKRDENPYENDYLFMPHWYI